MRRWLEPAAPSAATLTCRRTRRNAPGSGRDGRWMLRGLNEAHDVRLELPRRILIQIRHVAALVVLERDAVAVRLIVAEMVEGVLGVGERRRHVVVPRAYHD